MTFTLSTKPLADALALGVVNANISKFNNRSCIAQITATRAGLTINLEPNLIVTEIRLKGMGDSDSQEVRFVDSLLFKQLVSTFETNTISIEFVEGGIVLHSGKSKFNLANITESDGSLNKPEMGDYGDDGLVIDKSKWSFIKNRQQQFASMAFLHPVYTRYYINDSGDVLIGDFDQSVFSHSNKGTLGETCLISDTILNLICSVPDGAKIKKISNGYQIHVTTDAFELISDFHPEHEEDEGIGSYNSDIILSLLQKTAQYVKIPSRAVEKILKQSELLSRSSEDSIMFGVQNGVAFFEGSNIDGKIDVEGNKDVNFKVEFKLKLLSQVLTNYPGDTIYVGPMVQDDEVVGIVSWDDDIEVVLAGKDD